MTIKEIIDKIYKNNVFWDFEWCGISQARLQGRLMKGS